MTCLSSRPVCNQIQPAAEVVALWVLCSKGLALIACQAGEVVLSARGPHMQSPSLRGVLKSHSFGTFLDTIVGQGYLVNTKKASYVSA